MRRERMTIGAVAGLVLGLVMALCGVASAQEDRSIDGVQAEAAEQVELIEFAGFAVPRLGDGVVMRFGENSNGMMYGLDIFRDDPADPLRFADSTPLIRASQSVRPLAEIGTIEDMAAAVLHDARELMRATGFNEEMGRELGEERESTREIFGAERSGVRFSTVLRPWGEDGQEPLMGRVEAYAFEHEGRGVAVIVKVAQSDDAAAADDREHLERLLGGMRMRVLDEDSAYTYRLGGYPVRLPVASRVGAVGQPNEHTLSADVALEGASLNLNLVRVPEGRSAGDAFGQVERAYARRMMASVQQSGGRVRLAWEARSFMPAGESGEWLIGAPVWMLETGGGGLYRALYTDLGGQMVLSGVFSSRPEDSGTVHRYARIFAGGFAGDARTEAGEGRTVRFGGQRVAVPAGVHAAALEEGDILSGSVVFAADSRGTAEDLLGTVVDRRRSVTVMRGLGADEDAEKVALGLAERLGTPEDAGAVGENGGWGSMDVTGDRAQAEAGGVDLRLGWRVVELGDGDRVVVMAVSPRVLGADARSVAEMLIGDMDAVAEPGRIAMPFGELVVEPGDTLVIRDRQEDEGRDLTRFAFEGDRVSVYTLDPDSRMNVLSDRWLANLHLRDHWNRLGNRAMRALFPVAGDGLEGVEIAGYPGLELIAELPGEPGDAGDDGSGSAGAGGVGVFGFRHGEGYTAIVIEQRSGFDEERMRRVLELFRGDD